MANPMSGKILVMELIPKMLLSNLIAGFFKVQINIKIFYKLTVSFYWSQPSHNVLSCQHTETVSTSLSDFHKLVLTVLKTAISKSKPREIHYRYYKKSDSLKFNIDLKNAFAHEKIESCIKFDEVFMTVLNSHAPLKKENAKSQSFIIYG